MVGQAFGRNLAYHRERLRLTQAELAERIESSPSYLGHLERGEREPSLLTIEELSKALGIRAGEFFVERRGEGGESRELEELVRGRPQEDLQLIMRLARAAFEDPRIEGVSSRAADGAAPAVPRNAKRSRKVRSGRSKGSGR